MESFISWDKLHISIRGILICIIGLAPFWYLLLHLFGGTVFQNEPLFIQLIIVYCLTIAMVAIFVIMITFLHENFDVEEHKPYTLTFFACILILSIMIMRVHLGSIHLTRTRDVIVETYILEVFYICLICIFKWTTDVIKKRKEASKNERNEEVR